MHRSVLLLLMSALLLNVAVGLPLSLEESAEKSWLDQLLGDVWESDELLDSGHENAIHKRAAKDKDSSSPSEEHKDKAKNSSGESSSEEQKTTTQAPARRRRSDCNWVIEKIVLGEPLHTSATFENGPCQGLIRLLLDMTKNKDKADITERFRRQVSGQEQQRMNKASGELELDALAEKELDEEMARAVADVKDNGSIEDYAQGCEVMEVSSKEANEATYAE